MKGISSWTSDAKIADSFASVGEARDSLVFKTISKNGVSINHLTKVPGESEILMSSTNKYRIINIEKIMIAEETKSEIAYIMGITTKAKHKYIIEVVIEK